MANPPTIASRYQIQREIGRGGAGVVYAVKHVHTGERLAMKVLLSHAAKQPDIVQRFRREMQASARVRSEHVVRVTDADVAPELKGAPFLIMELLNGADLGRLVTERGASPKDEALWLLGQAARGLDRAHEAGIVHRDLKPENLFLHRTDDQRLIVKVLDFGIARMTDGVGLSDSEARMTRDGAILGTPLFLTPEQALGETEKIGPGTDIWPIGLIAHELLTGASYWAEEQMTTLLAKIIFKSMVPPSAKGCTLGPRFDQWFLRSCAREPAERWPSVGAQVEALADALDVDRALLSAVEPPPGLRAWLLARPKRGDDAIAPELSLASITGTTEPAPASSSQSLSESLEVSYQAGSAGASAPQPRLTAGPPPAKRRTAVIVGSGLLAILLAIGAIELARSRTGTPPPNRVPPSSGAPASPAAHPPLPTPPSPQVDAGPSSAAVIAPIAVPGPGARHGAPRDKPAPSHHHGKKHPRSGNPADYDPQAP